MMVHPDPTKRAKIFTEEEPKEDDYFVENSDWYTQTREATLEEVQKLFNERGLKIQQVPIVQIDGEMGDESNNGEESKD